MPWASKFLKNRKLSISNDRCSSTDRYIGTSSLLNKDRLFSAISAT